MAPYSPTFKNIDQPYCHTHLILEGQATLSLLLSHPPDYRRTKYTFPTSATLT